MNSDDYKTEPWAQVWNSLEVLGNVEYLARTSGALTVEQKLYLDVMYSELMRLRNALEDIHDANR